ncbi:hypothetical protein HHK36_009153 [Tetracentron sinense]|uniref:ABC transporter D family member 1 n=1 Tax=Tetracentron sinense TaxID=13715 RepID=A0A834ZIE4_TETSI|nr:hypothetical protein HHK36_009153 [Tetracentron sinense]
MPSLQLLQLTEHGRSFLASRRRTLAVATGILVAGGTAAYMQSRLGSRCKRPVSLGHNTGPVNNKGKSNKVLRTALSNRLAKVQGFLFRAAFLGRVPSFLRLIIENLLLCFLQSTLYSTSKYITGTLSLRFRQILTKLIHSHYFQNMSYYKISHVDGRITNPEQRIASDIPRFCSELSDLVQEDLIAVTDGLLYTWRLCSYASPKYVFWILAYVTGAGAMIRNFSPAFGKLMSEEQQLEGEYRQLHSRLRTHAESVAFYGGETREESHIQQKFKSLVRHMNLVLHDHWWFGMIQDFLLKYLGATVAVILIIEPFFSGNLRPDTSTLGRAEMLSNLRYHTSVIISLFQSLGTLSISSRRLNRLSGYADRIHELMVISKELSYVHDKSSIQRNGSRNYVSEANYIEFAGVKVVTPTGNVLVEDLRLRVESGSNLLITGFKQKRKKKNFLRSVRHRRQRVWLRKRSTEGASIEENFNQENFSNPIRPVSPWIGSVVDISCEAQVPSLSGPVVVEGCLETHSSGLATNGPEIIAVRPNSVKPFFPDPLVIDPTDPFGLASIICRAGLKIRKCSLSPDRQTVLGLGWEKTALESREGGIRQIWFASSGNEDRADLGKGAVEQVEDSRRGVAEASSLVEGSDGLPVGCVWSAKGEASLDLTIRDLIVEVEISGVTSLLSDCAGPHPRTSRIRVMDAEAPPLPWSGMPNPSSPIQHSLSQLRETMDRESFLVSPNGVSCSRSLSTVNGLQFSIEDQGNTSGLIPEAEEPEQMVDRPKGIGSGSPDTVSQIGSEEASEWVVNHMKGVSDHLGILIAEHEAEAKILFQKKLILVFSAEGPNGSGKSSLFRVLGGLWPLVSGHIVKPGIGSDLNKEIFYVPQRPYTAVGTLRDQLIYPLTADKEIAPLTHSGMVELLRNVDLEYLLDRYEPEKEINWGDELSLGEQQRLGMARLFFHKPKFAILDECTSAVTTDMEERFCAKVRAMGTSCITISHRPALVAFHDMVLSLDGEGGWSVHDRREDSPIPTEAGVNMKKSFETDRQSDAMAVQRAFATTRKDSSFSNSNSQSYVAEVIAMSPPVDHSIPLPVVRQLQKAPRALPLRVAAMFKVLIILKIEHQWLIKGILRGNMPKKMKEIFTSGDVKYQPYVSVVSLVFPVSLRRVSGFSAPVSLRRVSGFSGFFSHLVWVSGLGGSLVCFGPIPCLSSASAPSELPGLSSFVVVFFRVHFKGVAIMGVRLRRLVIESKIFDLQKIESQHGIFLKVLERGRKGGTHTLWVPEEALGWLKVISGGEGPKETVQGYSFPNLAQAKTGTLPSGDWARGPSSIQTRGLRISHPDNEVSKAEYETGIRCHVDQQDGKDRLVIDLDSGSFGRWTEAVVCSIRGSEEIDNWEEVSKIIGQLLPEESEITLFPFEANRAIFHTTKPSQLYTLCTDRTFPLSSTNLVGFHRWWPASNTLSSTGLSKPRWVALRGIPFHLWVPMILNSIGTICGGLVEVHPSTTEMSDLSFAKIRVKGGLYSTPRVISLIFHSITYPVEVSDWEECCENCRRWPDSMEVRYCRSWVEVAEQPVDKDKTRCGTGLVRSINTHSAVSNLNSEQVGSLFTRTRDASPLSTRRSAPLEVRQCSQVKGSTTLGSELRLESPYFRSRVKEAKGDSRRATPRDLLKKTKKGKNRRKNQKRNIRKRKQQKAWREKVPSVLLKHTVLAGGLCEEQQGSGEIRPSPQIPNSDRREDDRLSSNPIGSSSTRGGRLAIQMDQDPSVPGLGPFAGSGMGLSGDPIHRPAFMGPLDLSPNIRIDRDQRSGPFFIDPSDPFGLDRIIENQEAKVRRQSHL